MKQDDFGDRMKMYEARGMSLSHVLPGEIMVARLDGKSFHSFTKGLERPIDLDLRQAMEETMLSLVAEFKATLGYVQSDEITLVWITELQKEIIFGGRVQKIVSLTAAHATAEFNAIFEELKPLFIEQNKRPRFDSRVFTVPNKEEAVNCLLWRQQDATKNAITMAAQSVFSHKELQGKSGNEKQEMLFSKGINFNDYPPFFKRGVFGRRVVEERILSEEELLKLPEHVREKQAGQVVTRSKIRPFDYWIKFERGDFNRVVKELFD